MRLTSLNVGMGASSLLWPIVAIVLAVGSIGFAYWTGKKAERAEAKAEGAVTQSAQAQAVADVALEEARKREARVAVRDKVIRELPAEARTNTISPSLADGTNKLRGVK